ncbi:MAG: SDR family oxidoreductase [Bacteroidia bacterium]|nr:MAG: SDR family oxidoreductase [Bacteroidia bacterium]
MAYSFKNKVVIVTGASSGIGLAIAKEFAIAGSIVVIAARSEGKLDKLAHEIRIKGGEAYAIPTDVTDEEQCRLLVSRTIEKYGKLDILINNAGISMRANLIDVESSVLKRLMDVNFWGVVHCTKHALPHILESRGVLVGISSVAGFHGLPGRIGYAASKFAMHGFLESLRIEYLRQGLKVMIVAPGFTASNIRYNALLADGSKQGETPRNETRMMKPEYVARWVLKGIRRKKRNKILTWGGRFTALFQRIIPGVVDFVYYKMMEIEPGSPLKDQ